MKSPKEVSLDQAILDRVPPVLHELTERLLADPEIKGFQDYANTVAIRRLGYNDHGPVHMRKVVIHALKMARLLREAGVPLSLEAEEAGTYEDSVLSLLLAGFMHDIGMAVTRENHENYSAELAAPMVRKYAEMAFPDDPARQVVIRSMVAECIVGHMATVRVHSLEAGLILIADGCDMEKGRARIPMLISRAAKVGDIHKYSSAAVERIEIGPGEDRPICITIRMSERAGYFQIEEVLFPKLNASPAREHVQLVAEVPGDEAKRYL